MQFLVEREVSFAVAAFEEPDHPMMDVLEPGDLDLRGTFAGKSRRGALQQGLDLEKMADMIERKFRNGHSTVRVERDEFLDGQDLQRLPQGRARDAQLLTQLRLGHPLAGQQLMAEDHVAELDGQFVVQASTKA